MQKTAFALICFSLASPSRAVSQMSSKDDAAETLQALATLLLAQDPAAAFAPGVSGLSQTPSGAGRTTSNPTMSWTPKAQRPMAPAKNRPVYVIEVNKGEYDDGSGSFKRLLDTSELTGDEKVYKLDLPKKQPKVLSDLTNGALAAKEVAKATAVYYGQNYVGPEMLLVGLSGEEVLSKLGKPEDFAKAFEAVVGKGKGASEPEANEEMYDVEDEAFRQADETGWDAIYPSHLILALLKAEGKVDDIFKKLKADKGALRDEIMAKLT